jgi:threonine/homoserine/homoserine lactone efflux protein
MPVEPTTLLAFIAAALVIVISPGPDTLIILRYTIAAGQRTGFATVTGVQIGLVFHTVLAAVGLSLVIASSEALFRAISIAGAAYLAWLAVQGFRSALLNFGGADGTLRIGPAKAARDAMLTNLLNPKVILLFLALMPNFVVVERGQVPLQLTILGIALIAVNTVWQGALTVGAQQARRWLDRPRIQRAVSWGTGTILLGFAIALLIEHAL